MQARETALFARSLDTERKVTLHNPPRLNKETQIRPLFPESDLIKKRKKANRSDLEQSVLIAERN